MSMRQIALALGDAQDRSALQNLLMAHLEHLAREGRRIKRMHRHLCRWLGRKA